MGQERVPLTCRVISLPTACFSAARRKKNLRPEMDRRQVSRRGETRVKGGEQETGEPARVLRTVCVTLSLVTATAP